MDFTKEELHYIWELVQASYDGLKDLYLWKEQNIMTEKEIADELLMLVNIRQKLKEVGADEDCD